MIFLKIFLLFFEGVNSSSEKNECERDCQQRLLIAIPDGLVLTMKRHLVGKKNETIYTFGNYLLKFHEKTQRWFLVEKHEKIRRVHCFSKNVSNLSLEKDDVFKCFKAKRPILSKIMDIVCSECKPAIELGIYIQISRKRKKYEPFNFLTGLWRQVFFLNNNEPIVTGFIHILSLRSAKMPNNLYIKR